MGVICTILNVSLVASARDLVVAEAVRVDISKLGVVEHLGSSIVTKLLANNLCCVCIPTVVADDSVHSVAVCRPHIALVGRASAHESNLVVASRGCVVPTSCHHVEVSGSIGTVGCGQHVVLGDDGTAA